jgi:hypothetical protein
MLSCRFWVTQHNINLAKDFLAIATLLGYFLVCWYRIRFNGSDVENQGLEKMDIALEKLKDEVLRKIGRNAMLFQQMEHMLKALLTYGNVSGYASELQIIQKQRIATIGKQTMGQVLGEFLENAFLTSEETKNEPEELKEEWLSMRFTIECDESHYKERKTTLASIVAERNDLIHHLLPKWNLDSYESGLTTGQYLDEQREKILPELDYLKAKITTFQEIANFILSDEGKKQFELSCLRHSQLVAWLFESAQQNVRADNWVVLDTAIQFIRQHAPEQLTDLYKRHGYKKLKDIMIATEYFDISEELTNKGGICVLYRIKPDLNFIG